MDKKSPFRGIKDKDEDKDKDEAADCRRLRQVAAKKSSSFRCCVVWVYNRSFDWEGYYPFLSWSVVYLLSISAAILS